jgi:hypothetical protein
LNKDIRLKVTFPNHKKTIKLIRLIGAEGFYSLVQLWCYVAQNHPKGILKDYDKYDLEIAARWTGARGEFTKSVTRKDIDFVKKITKGFEINDWEEHNPYVFHADERSEKARKAAKARWEPSKDNSLSDASSIDVAILQASTSNAPSPDPIPLPPPTPKPIKTFSLDSEEYQLSELLFGEIKKRNPNHKKPNLQNWAKDIDKMIRLDKRDTAITREVILWCQSDNFWQNNILSAVKLREKFDQLFMQMKKPSGGNSGKHTGLNEKDYSEGIAEDGTF